MSEITILPRSRIIRVEFEMALPADASKDEVLEWVRFNLWGGSMPIDSPLGHYGVEALCEPVLTDTETHLHEEVKFEGGGRSTIRKWRSPAPFNGQSGIDVVLSKARGETT